MPKGLFLKIFLWFWVATSLVGGVFVVTVELSRSERQSRPFRRMARNALLLHVEQTARVLANGNLKDLQDHLQSGDEGREVHSGVFDSDDRQVAGTITTKNTSRLRNRARESGRIQFERTGEMLLMARTVGSGDGQSYTIVAEVAGPRLVRPPSLAELLLRLVVIILTGGVVCYALARYLSSPVNRLQTASRQLAAGDLAARVGKGLARRHDEFGDLAQDFDQMAERIELLVNTQRQLLRDISHELRSPLARLQVALELARKHSPTQAATALDRIEREALRINELIGQLLDLARSETGQNFPHRDTFSLSEIIDEVVEDAQFEVQSQNRSVRIVELEECWVAGVKPLLRSAIDNVVRNAVLYTQPGTEVELSLRPKQAQGGRVASLLIRDHGPGLPQSELAKIFEPFYRVDQARDRQTGGTGLRLAIAQQIITRHGGSIRASNQPGGGLAVHIQLPAIPANSQESVTKRAQSWAQ